MPDELYKNGLQRLQFLPAIALIKKHNEIVHIETKIDYRLRYLTEAGIYYTPLNKAAEENMEKTFHLLAHGEPLIESKLFIHERPIRLESNSLNLPEYQRTQIPKSILQITSLIECDLTYHFTLLK